MATTTRLGLRLLEGTDVANYELINQVLLLLDELVAKQEAFGLIGHTHDGTNGNAPKIPYGNITGVPASLPANGGNADTVDGKHASDLALNGHTHDAATITVAGFLSAADKVNLNTMVSRVNQALTTTSSPTFNVVTANKVIGAVYA